MTQPPNPPKPFVVLKCNELLEQVKKVKDDMSDKPESSKHTMGSSSEMELMERFMRSMGRRFREESFLSEVERPPPRGEARRDRLVVLVAWLPFMLVLLLFLSSSL